MANVMYNPRANNVSDAHSIDMLRSTAFGHLVSATNGLRSSALPFVVDAVDGQPLRIRAHLARANRHHDQLDGADVLLIASSVDGYVSPAWYPSKAEHQKVVPTWNYDLVHVHGVACVHDDVDWLRFLVSDLTDLHEAHRVTTDSRAPAWSISDAPAGYIDKMLRAIVGVSIDVVSVEGKRKLSQNRSDADVEGVLTGLDAMATPSATALAAEMRRGG